MSFHLTLAPEHEVLMRHLNKSYACTLKRHLNMTRVLVRTRCVGTLGVTASNLTLTWN